MQESQLNIRPAAVAGSFYPATSQQLETQVNNLLHQVSSSTEVNVRPRAIIVPHAGYIYSGEIAAQAYQTAARFAQSYKRIAIIGPCHRVWISGMAIPSQSGFATPMGILELDRLTLEALSKFSSVEYSDIAHQDEHSLEVQLPFIQKLFGNVKIIPVLVGDAATRQVATLVEFLLNVKDCLLVISSDLSHFLSYESANQIDSETSEFILAKDFESLDHQRACGCTPIRGLLSVAREQNMDVKLIAQCNSGDTAGDKSRVVGYAAYAIYPTH